MEKGLNPWFNSSRLGWLRNHFRQGYTLKRLELKIPPLVILLLAAVFMYVVGRYAPVVLIMFAGQVVIAVILAIVGAQVAIAGARACYDQKTTVNPLHPEQTTHLMTDGVFKVSRNPIYLGLACMLLGFVIWLGALTALLVWAGFVAYITRFQIIPEERSLQQQFGDTYSAYRQRTRRWL